MILGMPARRIAVAGPTIWITGEIGSATGLLRGSPDGISWGTAIDTGKATAIVDIVGCNGLVAVLYSDGVVRYSNDAGATWAVSTLPVTPTALRDAWRVDGSTFLLSIAAPGTGNGVYRTTDSGANWTGVFTNRSTGQFAEYVGFIVVCGGGTGYGRSNNGGASFTFTNAGGISPFFVTETLTRAVYLPTSGNVGRVSSTPLVGWVATTITGASGTVGGLSGNPATSDLMAVYANGSVYYSNDDASSWSSGASLPFGAFSGSKRMVDFDGSAWVARGFDSANSVAYLYRATSVSGGWTQVASFSSQATELQAVRYIGP